MFRQDFKLLELVQSLPKLVFAQTVAGPPAHHLMERLPDLLEYLSSQAPALFALPKPFVDVHKCSLEHHRLIVAKVPEPMPSSRFAPVNTQKYVFQLRRLPVQ
jgi:hypothetical protein